MRRILLLLLMVLCLIPAKGQELTVKSFVARTNDLAASTHERKDINGNSCALVKVQLATAGAKFSPNIVGNVEYKVNEYWVYLPTMNKHLEVKHPNFLTMDVVFADYGVKLEPKNTYSLVLSMPTTSPTQQVTTSQYLMFNLEPADAILEVNGEAWANTDGKARKLVPFGEYAYTVQANNYHTYSGTATVNDPNDKTVVNVSLKPAFGSVNIPSSETLTGATVYIDNQRVGSVPYVGETVPSGKHQVRLVKPMYKSLEQEIEVRDGEVTEFSPTLSANFATVTLSVDNNAQIYVNEELKGIGSWTGKLEYGDCSIKTEKESHRSQTKIYTISAAQNNQTITLASPTPIYGSINVGVLPDESDVYIDGKNVGTTPLFLQNVLIGRHKVEVRKSGYQAWAENITVEENTMYNIENKALAKGPANTLSFTINGVSFEMIRVEAGTFRMGATPEMENPMDWEKPSHQVTLTNNYYLGKYEVTQALWQAVMGSNPSYFKGGNLPVEWVSWNDCQDFIGKLNRLTGENFRLPTEAEWEYAARGGNKSRGYQYSGSNNLSDVAWYDENSGGKTHPVGTKQPNELGIYDMSGNVWEWCQDWWGNYSSSAQTNPKGPTSGSLRVLRGGSWYEYDAEGCRSSCRSSRYYPDDRSRVIDLGLRLCLSE